MPRPLKKKRKNNKKKKPSSASLPTQSDSPNVEFEAANNVGSEDKEKQALYWLIDAFSSCSMVQIESAYREAGSDPYKAAGILGSKFEDPVEELAGCISGGREAKGLSNSKGAGGKRKQKKVVAASGMVTDVIGKRYSAEGRRSRDYVNVEGKGPKGRTYNVEEAEEFLCSMLGHESELGMGVVRDVLGQCGCDIEKSTDNISDSTYQLSEKEESFLPCVGYSVRNQLSSKSELMKPDLQQQVLESLFNIPEYQKYEPNCMDWKKVVKKVESFGQGLEFRSSTSSDTQSEESNVKEDFYQVCRSLPRKHWDMMRAYYQKAAIAYSRGERAHASYLSEKGRFYRDLAREADEKASREIFEARNKDIKNTVTIDLHGQHVKQGIGLLKLHLLLFTFIPSVYYLRVITGCGTDGVGKGNMKRSVLGLVEKEGIEWSEENAGAILLRIDGPKEYSFMEYESDLD